MTEVVELRVDPGARLGRGWLTATAPIWGASPPNRATARSSPMRMAARRSRTRPRASRSWGLQVLAPRQRLKPRASIPNSCMTLPTMCSSRSSMVCGLM